jgi:hypothetical protein
MTERAYRLVIGICMILFLFMQWDYAMYLILIVLLIEGLTNWRVPILVSRLFYPKGGIKVTDGENAEFTINYDAERMIRWIVFIFVGLGSVAYSNQLWFIPWFIGLMLLLAGITGICPMAMFLRRAGMR